MSKSAGNALSPQDVHQAARRRHPPALGRDDRLPERHVDRPADHDAARPRRTGRSATRRAICCRTSTTSIRQRDAVPHDQLLDVDKLGAVARRRRVRALPSRRTTSTSSTSSITASLDLCTVDLSSLYLDISKDTLYCEARHRRARRSAQTAMYDILRGTGRLPRADPLFHGRGDLRGDAGSEGAVGASHRFPDAHGGGHPDADATPGSASFAARSGDQGARAGARQSRSASRWKPTSVLRDVTREAFVGPLDYRPGEGLHRLARRLQLLSTPPRATDPRSAESAPPIGISMSPARGKKCGRCWHTARKSSTTAASARGARASSTRCRCRKRRRPSHRPPPRVSGVRSQVSATTARHQRSERVGGG